MSGQRWQSVRIRKLEECSKGFVGRYGLAPVLQSKWQGTLAYNSIYALEIDK